MSRNKSVKHSSTSSNKEAPIMLDQLYEKLETVAQHSVNAMLQSYLPKHATIVVTLEGARQCNILIGTDLTDTTTPWVCIDLACVQDTVTSVKLYYVREGLSEKRTIPTSQPLLVVALRLSETLEQLEHGNIDKAVHVIEHARDYYALNQFLRVALD